MKNSLALLALITVLLAPIASRGQAHLLFGSNWMPMDERFLVWDTVCNAYHGGGFLHDTTINGIFFRGADHWLDGTAAANKLVYLYDNIFRYSGAERFKYLARTRPTNGTQYAGFYFLDRDTLIGRNVTGGEWQIDQDAMHTFADAKILWNNQYPGGWNAANPGSLKIVVKLHVEDTALASDPLRDSAVITIILKQHYWDTVGVDHDSLITVATFNVKWSSFHNTDDRVFFQSDSIVLVHPLYGLNNSYTGGLELEVHSRRYVTSYLDWVCVENMMADALLAGYDLDPTNSAKAELMDSVYGLIHNDSLTVHSYLGAKLHRFYLYDEPAKSQFAALGYFNQVLLPGLGATEFEGDNDVDVKEYIAQTHPNTLWRFVGGPGCGVSAYCDSGLESRFTARRPYSDSATSTYSNAVKRVYPTLDWGYAPHDSGVYGAFWSKERIAMSNSYGLGAVYHSSVPPPFPFKWPDSLYRYGVDTSFDMLDYSRDGMPEQLYQEIQHCASAATAALIDTAGDHPSEWWADFIFNAVVDDDGFYSGTVPPIPEQFSAQLGLAWTFGAHGVFIYQTVSGPHTGFAGEYQGTEIGIVDDSGFHRSDFDTISGAYLPTMWQRNAAWANAHRKFLDTWGDSLYDARWTGAVTRCGFANVGDANVYGGLGLAIQTFGVNEIVDESKDSVTRPILTTWVTSNSEINSHFYEIPVRDSFKYVAYGCFESRADPEVKFLLSTNLACDPRNLRAEYIVPDTDYANPGYIKRGRRTITFTLKRNPLKYYHIQLLDGSGWDSLVAGDAAITATYQPGQSKLWRISGPLCDIVGGAFVDNEEIGYSNGVHLIKRGSGAYTWAFVRNDSLFLQTFDNCVLGTERLLSRGGIDTIYNGPPERYHVYNHNPTLASHRSVEEALVTWQRTYVDSAGGAFAMILGIVINATGDTISQFDPLLNGPYIDLGEDPEGPGTYLAYSSTYRSVPAVCGTDSGWVLSWNDSSAFTRLAALAGQGGYYRRSCETFSVSAPQGTIGAWHSSIGWGTNAIRTEEYFKPHVHVVWQQDTGGRLHIWHQEVEVRFNGECPQVHEITNNGVERVSEDNNWACYNQMPCLTVDAQGNNTDTIPNHVYFSWTALFPQPSYKAQRIEFRERIRKNIYGSTCEFASGVRNFVRPNVFVCPADTTGALTLLTWCGDPSRLYLFDSELSGLSVIPIAGWFPSVGFKLTLPDPMMAPWIDQKPSLVFQTPEESYRAVLVSHEKIVGNTLAAVSRNGTVASVFIEPSHRTTVSTCSPFAVAVSLRTTYPLDPNVLIVHPMPANIPMLGNGTAENGAVKSEMMSLHMGMPLVIQRAIIAQDTASLSRLTAGGRKVRVYIELMDSATHAVLAIIDSFIVQSGTDTIDERGTLMFDPDMDVVEIPVYVRARIVADTGVARWSAHMLTKYESEEEAVADGFAKSTVKNIGRGGWGMMKPNPIGLIVYPNPLSTRTRISFSVPEDANGLGTRVIVYSIDGKNSRQVVNSELASGRHVAEFSTNDLPSGQYIVSVRMMNHTDAKLIEIRR